MFRKLEVGMGIFKNKILLFLYYYLIKGFKCDLKTLAILYFYHLKSCIFLIKIKNRFRNKTCFCVGNGSSILKENLNLLNEGVIIYTNKAYTLMNNIKGEFEIILFSDYNRFIDSYSDLRNKKNKNIVCSTNFLSSEKINTKYYSQVYFIMPSFEININYKNKLIEFNPINKPKFNDKLIQNGIAINYSVIFSAIQLASYMNAKNIICLGVDMNYKSDKPYFDKTINPLWNDFNYSKHAKPSFIKFKEICENKSINLINSNINSKEEDLVKMSLIDAINLK